MIHPLHSESLFGSRECICVKAMKYIILIIIKLLLLFIIINYYTAFTEKGCVVINRGGRGGGAISEAQYGSCMLWDYGLLLPGNTLKGTRIILKVITCDYKRESSVTQMICNLGWQRLEARRAVSCLSLMYKMACRR